MAHGGLAQVQPLRGAAHVPLAHERRQHGEQVQVDAAEFDRFHACCRQVSGGVGRYRFRAWRISHQSISLMTARPLD
jgi:hypothetical protein